MAGSLVQTISQITDAVYGVNILEIAPPGGVQSVSSNVVASVGNFPWGPVDTVTEITSAAELFETFAPNVFGVGDSYAALKAFINKPFSRLKIVRISPSAQAIAVKVFNDADGSPDPSVDVAARYPGLIGNSITVSWAVNASDGTARDATVTIGTSYSVTYLAVATIVSAALVVTDPGDPYVSFAKHSGAVLVPAVIGATALASGANGTAAAGDYSTSLELLAPPAVEWAVAFVAEPEVGILDDVNDACKTFVDTHGRGIVVLATPLAQAYATALTYVTDYRAGRLDYPWPRVYTVNTFDSDRDPVLVNGNSFQAAAIAGVAPEKSPGGAPGARFLKGITSLETDATSPQLNNLLAAGVSPFFMSRANEGAIMHGAVLTTLTAGQTKIARRRMTDFITSSIAEFMERFVGELLDIDLSNRALGQVTGPEIAQVRQFLQDLLTNNRIKAYGVDEFGANTATNIAAGEWRILIEVTTISAQERIVLMATIGETVTVSIVNP